MEIKEIKINELHEYPNNPRNNDNAVEAVAASIKEFGFKVPIVVDADNVIVAGHTRLKAAKLLGLDKVPCIVADDLTPEQVKAFRVADNKTAELAEWNFELLESELAELAIMDFDMEQFGFDESDFEENEYSKGDYSDGVAGTLAAKYIVPPFSVLNARDGKWQERKKQWCKIIKSENGRSDDLLGDGLNTLNAKMTGGSPKLTGTSIFDPVLCEALINWFCPVNGKIIDPFAGGSVRGLISSFLGNNYTGVDLSSEQIKCNYDNYEELKNTTDFFGNALKKPNWINADSSTIDEIVHDTYDFMLTCPPYADLEVYSDDPRDISNMPYEKFVDTYGQIIKKTTEKLKDNAFAAIVIGEVRDKKGYYRNFVGDTIQAFENAGLKYYNECILVDMIGTAAIRCGRQFAAGRKVVKTHQNVLIFVKGNEKEILKSLTNYDYDFDNISSELLENE